MCAGIVLGRYSAGPELRFHRRVPQDEFPSVGACSHSGGGALLVFMKKNGILFLAAALSLTSFGAAQAQGTFSGIDFRCR